MQLVINSANINTFFVKVTFDIYGRKVIWDTSGTTYQGGGAGLVKGISFSLIDQSGLELAGGINFTSPQIVGPVTSANNIWTLDLSSVNFAFLFQTYQVTAAIQESNGNIYTTVPVFTTVCQPTDITDYGYVPGVFQIIPDTVNSVLTVKELTQFVYNSLTPTAVTKTGTLNFPTGTIAPINFSNTPFSNNIFYTGQYLIICTTVGVYNLQNDNYVNVTYYTNNVFDVTVANKMSDLFCCIQKVQQTAIKHCNDAIGENARQQMQDICPYLIMGLIAESSGQDASSQANYIKKYLACNCGSDSISQTEFTPINPAVTSIVLAGVGGTTIPAPTVTGNTQTYNIKSSIYQIVKGNTGDMAFTLATNTSIANTVQYTITFNYDTQAGYILTAIQNDPVLLAQLNNLVTSSAFNASGLNGSCIINLNVANYSLSQAVTGATLVTSIFINGVSIAAPSNLFANSPTSVSGWLNGLSLGTYSATVVGGVLTVQSIGNSNALSTMSFSNPTSVVLFASSKATLTQVLQAIINYACALTDAQSTLSSVLSLCTFDYNGNIVYTNYAASQAGFNSGIAAAICNIVNRVYTLTGVTCAKIQSIFQQNPSAVFNIATDGLLAFVGGNCTNLTAKQLALALIGQVNADTTVKNAWCAISCATPGVCPDIANTNLNAISQTSIGIYGVTWVGTTTSSQTVTVKYRITGATNFITATSNLGVLPNGNLSGSSPYLIPGLTGNTSYDIFIVNNCGGNGYIKQVVTPSSSVSSGAFLLSNASYTVCGAISQTLYSPSAFATGIIVYYDAGLTSPVTGYTYIASVSSGSIYQIAPSTGLVGGNTGLFCNTGTGGTYILGNNALTVCSGTGVTKYTNGAFAPGGVLYNDSALSSPVTGYSYVVNSATLGIYNINSVTGVIGSGTGTNCTGTATLTMSFVNAGGSFLNFQGTLNRPIDGNLVFTRIFADGFTDGACGTDVSSAQKNTTMTLAAGSSGVGSIPDSYTGSWASAAHYKMYNLIINGMSLVNGSTISVGSYLVTIVLPSCV